MATGCANANEKVRLSKSPASACSSSCVSGSIGIWPGRAGAACADNATINNTHCTPLISDPSVDYVNRVQRRAVLRSVRNSCAIRPEEG
jgi:hypothetical protein